MAQAGATISTTTTTLPATSTTDDSDPYDVLDLNFEVPSAQDAPEVVLQRLDGLSSGQLAALDLRLLLLPLPPSSEHSAAMTSQAAKLWNRRSWIHLETADLAMEQDESPNPLPKEHHTIPLDFEVSLEGMRRLYSAQLLAVKFQDGTSKALCEAANDELMQRRRKAKLKLLSHRRRSQRDSLGHRSDGQPAEAAAQSSQASRAKTPPSTAQPHPPHDSLLSRPAQQQQQTNQQPPPPPTSSPGSSSSAGSAADATLVAETEPDPNPHPKVKQEESDPDGTMDMDMSLPSPASNRSRSSSHQAPPPVVATQPPTPQASTSNSAHQQNNQPAQRPRSHSPAVPEPSAALPHLFACYLTYLDNNNNVQQLLHSRAMAHATDNIIAQIQITTQTAVAYFKHLHERTNFMLALRNKDPERKKLRADIGAVNMAAGLQWNDVRQQHKPWLTLLLRKIATNSVPPSGRSASPQPPAAAASASKSQQAPPTQGQQQQQQQLSKTQRKKQKQQANAAQQAQPQQQQQSQTQAQPAQKQQGQQQQQSYAMAASPKKKDVAQQQQQPNGSSSQEGAAQTNGRQGAKTPPPAQGKAPQLQAQGASNDIAPIRFDQDKTSAQQQNQANTNKPPARAPSVNPLDPADSPRPFPPGQRKNLSKSHSGLDKPLQSPAPPVPASRPPPPERHPSWHGGGPYPDRNVRPLPQRSRGGPFPPSRPLDLPPFPGNGGGRRSPSPGPYAGGGKRPLKDSYVPPSPPPLSPPPARLGPGGRYPSRASREPSPGPPPPPPWVGANKRRRDEFDEGRPWGGPSSRPPVSFPPPPPQAPQPHGHQQSQGPSSLLKRVEQEQSQPLAKRMRVDSNGGGKSQQPPPGAQSQPQTTAPHADLGLAERLGGQQHQQSSAPVTRSQQHAAARRNDGALLNRLG